MNKVNQLSPLVIFGCLIAALLCAMYKRGRGLGKWSRRLKEMAKKIKRTRNRKFRQEEEKEISRREFNLLLVSETLDKIL
jgi:hypothetical protein